MIGILVSWGLLTQLQCPEQRIAGVQQAVLVIPALVPGSLLASDAQNLVAAAILAAALALVIALHPARGDALRRGRGVNPVLLALAVLGAVPLVAYAVDMGSEARNLDGPPHHIQRLSIVAALAIRIVLVGVLSAFQTSGWRIPAWCAGAAAMVLGIASAAFPDQAGSVGRSWGVLATLGGAAFIACG